LLSGPLLAFIARLGELAEAHALDARIAEFRAERMAVNPPVLLCPYCGYEWASE
jgi:hypothetical protein